MDIAGYKAHRPDNPGPPTHHHVRPSRYRTFSAAIPVPMRPHMLGSHHFCLPPLTPRSRAMAHTTIFNKFQRTSNNPDTTNPMNQALHQASRMPSLPVFQKPGEGY
ncbi:hypothetical protein ABZX51_002609 [Aspergillus tubingensis]